VFKNVFEYEVNSINSPEEILKDSPDLIHIHHLKPLVSYLGVPFKNNRRKGQVPVIFTAHGLHIHKFEFMPSRIAKLKYFLRFQLEKHILPKPNLIIAVSKEDKQFMEEQYGLNNVSYLTNGIDIEAITSTEDRNIREQLNKQNHIPPGSFLFTMVARFDFQKGYDIAIRAIAQIKELLERGRRPCRFLFVGDGALLEEMKQLSQELNTTRYIRFLGARNDVYDILRASNACLLPSRWEGLPIVLLEAGLLKTPVMASRTYGNREIIGEKNGVLFDNLDSDALAHIIVDVLEEKYELSTMAQNLYDEVQNNYHLDTMLDGLKKIYSSF